MEISAGVELPKHNRIESLELIIKDQPCTLEKELGPNNELLTLTMKNSEGEVVSYEDVSRLKELDEKIAILRSMGFDVKDPSIVNFIKFE